MKSLISKTWKDMAKYLHSLPQNKGKELHHVQNRVGVFLACRLLVLPMTKQQHEAEHRTHQIRKDNMALIMEIRKFYDKRFGCKRLHDIRCLRCPLLNETLKEQIMLEVDKVEIQ